MTQEQYDLAIHLFLALELLLLVGVCLTKEAREFFSDVRKFWRDVLKG